jgi:hypothetical protein
MTDKEQQLEQFREAVERKAHEAEEASHGHPARSGPAPDQRGADVQESRIDTAHTQDQFSVRDKNTGKGKKTADKWNQ